MTKVTEAIWAVVEKMQNDPALHIYVNDHGWPELDGVELRWGIVNELMTEPDAVIKYSQKDDAYTLTAYGKNLPEPGHKQSSVTANLYVGVGAEGRDKKEQLDALFNQFGGGSAVVRGLLDGSLEIKAKR